MFGAALPVLLIFNSDGVGVGDALNAEPVAEEIVAMLAGSVGLLAAVPLTTALATWMAVHVHPASLGREEVHAHAH